MSGLNYKWTIIKSRFNEQLGSVFNVNKTKQWQTIISKNKTKILRIKSFPMCDIIILRGVENCAHVVPSNYNTTEL